MLSVNVGCLSVKLASLFFAKEKKGRKEKLFKKKEQEKDYEQ